MGRILILGGYGNFGKRIAAALVRSGMEVVIAGRDAAKAEQLAATLGPLATVAAFDVVTGLSPWLERLKPVVVINTCGPFQTADWSIARACIAAKVHYIDLADARRFVGEVAALDAPAKQAGVWVISGASTVPGLSSAVIETYRGEFSRIDRLRYGITPGQRAERGLATTQGILSYIGRPLAPVPGDTKTRYGWQDVYVQRYPELGRRWMANCDIPDLDIFPAHYGIRQVRFSAGMEHALVHFGIWLMGWAVRLGLPLRPERHASFLLRASNWFDRFGSADGGMHVILSGTGVDGRPYRRAWFIVATNGDGPQIPCIPAIILARKLARGERAGSGATACVGLVSLEEYLVELEPYQVRTYVQ